MTRILILLSLGAVINAALLPFHLDYPRGLENLFGTKREAAQKKKERSLCDTKECELIANVMKESMNEAVDPCDDFYEYACGRWSNVNPPPENKTTWSLWDMVQENVQKQIKAIILDDPKPTDLFIVKITKLWYKTCMDEEGAEKRGVEPILSTAWRFGGWPLIMDDGEWDSSIYSWQLVDDRYAQLKGLNSFYDISYEKLGSGNNRTIILDFPHLPANIYPLLPDGTNYSSSDASDENNESGEGSQEKGSKEKRPKEGEDDEGDEEEENNNEEDNEEGMVRKKVHRKLGRSRSNGYSEGLTKMRTKRDILKDRLLRGMRKQKTHATHGVHHNAKKRKGALNKKKQGKRKNHKRLGSNKKNNKRTKMTEENDLDEKMKKSKSIPTKARVHNTKQRGQRHHVAQRTRVSKRAGEDESPNTDDVETEDSSDNEVPTESNDEEQDNGSTNTDDNEDNDEEEDSGAEDDEEDEADDDGPEEREKERLTLVEKYKEYVFNVSLILSRDRGVEVSHEKMKKDISDMVDFTIKLGQLTVTQSRDSDKKMTLDAFQESYDNLPSRTSNSKVNWRRKVEKLLEEAGITLDGDVDLVTYPDYFKKLANLLDKTSGETIVNYIHWNFISDIVPMITKEMSDLFSNLYGPMPFSSREELCLLQVQFGNIVAYQFVEEHFSEEIAQTARDMIDDIQKEVEYQIKEATWMDEDTEHYILDKLVNMKSLIGYPEWYKNTTLVKRFFRGLTIGPSYYENLLNYFRYLKFKQLRESLDEEIELEVNPLELNAFFMPRENKISITAADFQSPFFAPNRPWNINYGIIGVVMGHEVNHGFDNSGHLYDRNGKPMEWLSAMAEAYDKRALCFVDQFNKYSVVKGKNITFENYGNQTAGENIADTMGLQAVFRAYQRRERECARPDPALPGLEKFSNEQTFFLSFANTWCESGDEEKTISKAKRDVHSTGRLRVIGSVSNSDDFAKAFNCPVGSPMNPEKKCNIWI